MERSGKLIFFLLPIVYFTFAVANESKRTSYRYVIEDVDKVLSVYDGDKDECLDATELEAYVRAEQPNWLRFYETEAMSLRVLMNILDQDKDQKASNTELLENTYRE